MSGLTPEDIAYYQAHADDDLRPNQIAADVVGILLAVSAVAARFLSRYRSRARLNWDDYLILVALMGQLTYAVLNFMSVHNGEGLHIIFVKNQKLFIQHYVAAIITYSITVMLTKISILFLYHRIFPVKWLLVVSYIMGAVVIAYNLAVVFTAAFQCIPLSSMWTGEQGQCINVSPPYTALAIVNVVTDVAILALPVKPVLGLQMRRGRKIQVLTIFLLGGIVCIFGIVCCIAISTMESTDPSYNAAYPGIWSYIEISVGILAACVPTFGPLFKHRRKNQYTTDPYGSGTGSGRRWKLTSNRSKDTQREDILLTETSDPNDSWVDTHCEGKKGVPGMDHQSPNIMVQKDLRQSVNFV
ncbi:hypothetical protein P170DRAFT_467920 [Aspergillus steynii IBT 23096]|uniref:Rhodopsin domain-containing protein n=1 Tax=Aspergillus steynii IBT 23096 TaxID=1392250 RepID=A0A2I2FU79_9EURO|nr:uncharacterized protein P170DRAFT_467920 [Aspergillus steynii IBT 23096]PLB44174.1 hypothetical protein P170DRAFT_467920 [Aspergillus steynii IBT 23096]